MKTPVQKQDILKIAEDTLSDLLNHSGEVIYSSHETLCEGDIYLLGLNPGMQDYTTIGHHLGQMLKRTKNAFLDEDWHNQQDEAIPDSRLVPLQKRVNYLLENLVPDPRKVCASNLIFTTTTSMKTLDFTLSETCWPVHDAVIKLIKPKMLLVFGNGESLSPYAFFKKRFYTGQDAVQTIWAGHGSWKCKGFYAEINGRRTFVAGLPHLSRYDVTEKTEVIDWIKRGMSDI